MHRDASRAGGVPEGFPSGRRALAALVGAALLALSACESGGGGGGEPPVAQKPAPNGSYLFVPELESSTDPDAPYILYFGSANTVGETREEFIELVNRSANVRYPINAVTITGADAEQFSVNLRDPLTLGPAEKVRLTVGFSPIDGGQKAASLDVDFDTIAGGDEAENVNEQNYYRARALEDGGDYDASIAAYDEYVDNRPVTSNKRRAAIKLPVVKEASVYGNGGDAELYLEAMNAREDDRLERATNALDTLLVLYPDGYLADDALYLRAYIELMDRDDPRAALVSLQTLRTTHPDTTYYDTALYAEGLAQQRLGNDVLARSIFLDLRDRHTGVDALGITLPKDELLSRLWFDRANEGLARL